MFVTVGSGITPDLLTFHIVKALVGFSSFLEFTTGGELHPALSINNVNNINYFGFGSKDGANSTKILFSII